MNCIIAQEYSKITKKLFIKYHNGIAMVIRESGYPSRNNVSMKNKKHFFYVTEEKPIISEQKKLDFGQNYT